MNNKVEEIGSNFIQIIGDLSAKLGFSKIAGQIYGLLFLSNGSLSLDEIAQKLGVSKGSVSLNVRALEEWTAVKKIWVKGSRKDFYEANLDTLKIVASRAKVAIRKRLDSIIGGLEDYKNRIIKMNGENLSKEDKRLISLYKERFSRLEKMKNTIMELTEGIPDGIFE